MKKNAKAGTYYVICNTLWGYVMAPHVVTSIAAGIRWAKDLGMAYRLFDTSGNLIRRGW